uniref:Uncharacterized protein n=1 Tax=Microplitis mediator bracovirus TaxID=1836595 RepID=A0A1D5API6_9VIRU|nr:hypothetical protein A6F54_59 [Microplitis mediator bracovirus]
MYQFIVLQNKLSHSHNLIFSFAILEHMFCAQLCLYQCLYTVVSMVYIFYPVINKSRYS